MAKVKRVIDGDTFETESGQRVRLADINAPEVGRPGADKAKKELHKLIDEKDVCIEPVGVSYGRIVAKVSVDGKSVNNAITDIVKVTKVIDGNTFETEAERIVRLADVNAPGVGNPGADKATAKLRELVYEKNVRIEPVDVSCGQIVAKVSVDGKSVNNAMNKSIMGRDKWPKPFTAFLTTRFAKDFAGINLYKLKFLELDKYFASELQKRMNKAELCIAAQCPLPAIVLYGSILEGILFKYAECYPDKFNAAKSRPKGKKGKHKKFSKWTFADFIKVSHEIELLKPDIMGHVGMLKEFRNYVHIQGQIAKKVTLSESDAIMCRLRFVKAIKGIEKASD